MAPGKNKSGVRTGELTFRYAHRPALRRSPLPLPSSARAARTGRNPRTGEEIKIAASKVPKFKPGKALKDALN